MHTKDSEILWQCIKAYQGQTFYTAKNLEFTYTVQGNEIFIDRKQKSVTRSTVDIAFQTVRNNPDAITGPKKIGCFGASYLYPIFVRFGLIRSQFVPGTKCDGTKCDRSHFVPGTNCGGTNCGGTDCDPDACQKENKIDSPSCL